MSEITDLVMSNAMQFYLMSEGGGYGSLQEQLTILLIPNVT